MEKGKLKLVGKFIFMKQELIQIGVQQVLKSQLKKCLNTD